MLGLFLSTRASAAEECSQDPWVGRGQEEEYYEKPEQQEKKSRQFPCSQWPFHIQLAASALQACEMLHGRFSRSYIIKPGCSEVCKCMSALVTFVLFQFATNLDMSQASSSWTSHIWSLLGPRDGKLPYDISFLDPDTCYHVRNVEFDQTIWTI